MSDLCDAPVCDCTGGSTSATTDSRWRCCDCCGGLVATDPETGEYLDTALVPPAPRKRRANPERALVVAIRSWLTFAIPSAVCWAAPNELPIRLPGRRGAHMMATRRASGMVPGAPDLTVALPGGHTVYLEVKAPGDKATGTRAGRLSSAQCEFHDRMARIGHIVHVVRSIADVQQVFRNYGAIK